MKISLSTSLKKDARTLIYALFENQDTLSQNIPKELAKDIQTAKENKIWTGTFGELYITQVPTLPYYRILVVGMGKESELTLERCRRLMGKSIKAVRALKQTSCTTNLFEQITNIPDQTKNSEPFNPAELLQALVETIHLANYTFTKYFSEEKKKKIFQIDEVSFLYSQPPGNLSQAIHQGNIIGEYTNAARNLVTDQAKIITPAYLEQTAKSIAKSNPKLNVRVLNKIDMEKLGMGALLGVTQGSPQPPKLIFLEYRGMKENKDNKSTEKITSNLKNQKQQFQQTTPSTPTQWTALIGKGITFDSGGYNLKPTKSIEEMKTDMAGAAAVLSTVAIAAKFNLPLNIVAVIPACENMIGGNAQHPGSIVTTHNGKTVEIGNTDAEGRLVLADAMSYTAQHYQPETMIDVATLTGACVVALGYYAAGLFSNDQQLTQQLTNAGTQSGDRVWSMPFFEEYQDWMDGSLSDLNNISLKGKGGEAGSIMGAVFLKNFIGNAKTRWAHLDIAGSANWPIEGDYLSRGPTGSGVRLLTYYLLNRTTNHK